MGFNVDMCVLTDSFLWLQLMTFLTDMGYFNENPGQREGLGKERERAWDLEGTCSYFCALLLPGL